MRKGITFAATIVVIGLFCAAPFAQGRGRGNSKPKSEGPAPAVSVTFVFSDTDRTAFRNYFTTHKIVAQPLPPGIARNVARGKPLPPGIAKKSVPNDLLITLAPRAGAGVTFSIVGDRVVALRNGLVVDVMVNVFR